MTLTLNRATRAEENYAANLRALGESQPGLIETFAAIAVDLEWVFGRDGSLTARDPGGRWFSGCSLPRRAAREMLKNLDSSCSVACFLAPAHAAQVATALERMRPEQAIVALVPGLGDLAVMLRCEDFATAIEAHRVWFVAGPTWARQLESLYEEQIGLATPAQFIRTAATDEELLPPLIEQAQRAISEITQRRAAAINAMRSQPWRRPEVMRLCVVAPSRFRLWNDSGHALTSAAHSTTEDSPDFLWTHFDADDPTCASPLALAKMTRECSALLTANTARCDLPGIVPDEMPWVTWVTGPRVPSFAAAGPNDRVVLADPNGLRAALAAGWPEARAHVATWPLPLECKGSARAADGLAIIADTCLLDAPEELNEYSSHTLLWNAVRDELLRDPFALGDDVNAYLAARMRAMDIGDEGHSRPTFVNRLIVPAFQQGLARVLLAAKLPLRLLGGGWQRIPQFAPHAHGPVTSRTHFNSLLTESPALIHVWPGRHAHPIDFTGLPVVRPHGLRAAGFVAAARRAVTVGAAASGIEGGMQRLDGRFVRDLLSPW